MPQNSLGFWRSLLRKKLPPSCLSSVRFTTFGLGDSSYPKYGADFSIHTMLDD